MAASRGTAMAALRCFDLARKCLRLPRMDGVRVAALLIALAAAGAVAYLLARRSPEEALVEGGGPDALSLPEKVPTLCSGLSHTSTHAHMCASGFCCCTCLFSREGGRLGKLIT